jgi:hypothetical protein
MRPRKARTRPTATPIRRGYTTCPSRRGYKGGYRLHDRGPIGDNRGMMRAAVAALEPHQNGRGKHDS